MKFYLYSIFFATFLFIPFFVFADTGGYTYTPLQDITMPNESKTLFNNNMLEYLANIYTLVIAIAGALAVVKIVYAGIKYMTSEAFGLKTEAKNEIRAALIGLLMILGSYVFLYTLNPKLTVFNLKIVSTKAIVGDGKELYIKYMTQGTSGAGGTGGASRPFNAGVGSVLDLIKKGQTFPDPSLNDYTLEQIKKSGLLDLNPSDASVYFPNGITAEGYLNLISSVAFKESSFNSNDVYYEKTMGKNSVGLLSLSYDDPEVKNLGYSEQDLKDPYKNIEVGVQIFKRTISAGAG